MDAKRQHQMDDENIEPPSKRCRKALFIENLEDDNLDFVINDASNLNDLEAISRQKVLKRIPQGSYVSTTSADRTRVYLRLMPSSEIWQDDIQQHSSHLSSERRILPNIFKEIRSKIQNERDSELEKKISYIRGEVQEIPSELRSNEIQLDSPEKRKKSANASDILWVEKFKPHNFMELLSDDGTNRTLLRWLKLWDKVVFNKEVKLRPPPDVTNNSFSKTFKNNSFKFKKQHPLAQELDKSNCPIQKIALLCGPPGLGKTTLAHVIATQAGYNVVEMNASDDRSVEIFRNQIQAATQMRAVFGEERRPNCLIIDEIDGAPLASINVLMSMVNVKNQEKNESKPLKKESKNPVLPRPIICICNNQYASSLRQLRMNALVIHFPSTTSNRLATRLMEISRSENLKTDVSTLMALCEKAENDIRSCISTLQFVTRKQRTLRMTDVHCLPCGQKDVQRSLFSVWQSLFQIPKPTRKPNFMNCDPEKTKAIIKSSDFEISRFDKILALSQGYNEHEKIHQGLFENYPMMKFKDHNMQNCVFGSEWLCFGDIFQQEIHHSQNYTVMPYLPFVTVALHFAFASNSYPKITFPTSQFQYNTKMASCKNIMTNVNDEISPALRSYLNATVLVLDLLPSLTKIIQPQFRPVNVQLYNTDEKAMFDHIVDVMISYNLNYHQQIGQEGQYNYVFEPQIDVISCFPEIQHPLMSYASKQAICHEINLEKMRREVTRKKVIEENTKKENIRPESKKVVSFYSKPNLQPKPVQEKPCVDFFGRVINKVKVNPKRDPGTDIRKSDVWFHFKEGYSNATRRKIRMKDLLTH